MTLCIDSDTVYRKTGTLTRTGGPEMADPPSHAQEKPPPRPRWVKVAGLVALVVIVLIAILLLVGPGGHSPGRH